MTPNKITKKKVKGWLDVLGYNYPGELTYESVHRWLMFFQEVLRHAVSASILQVGSYGDYPWQA